MEFLQFILNFLTAGSQGQFKELFTLLEQNNFNLPGSDQKSGF